MENWISEHWLALYGAIAGTLALSLNVSRFIHAVKKDRVNLKLTVEDHPQKSENIKMIMEPTSDRDWENPAIVETHTLTVRNIGNVDAYIEDAWIICKKGDKHKVLVSDPNHQMMLSEIPRLHTVKLAPKSSITLNVYLSKGEEVFDAKKAEIVDSTGNSWRINA